MLEKGRANNAYRIQSNNLFCFSTLIKYKLPVSNKKDCKSKGASENECKLKNILIVCTIENETFLLV